MWWGIPSEKCSSPGVVLLNATLTLTPPLALQSELDYIDYKGQLWSFVQSLLAFWCSSGRRAVENGRNAFRLTVSAD